MATTTVEHIEDSYEILAVGTTIKGTTTKEPGTVYVIGHKNLQFRERGGLELAWLRGKQTGKPAFGGGGFRTVEEAKAAAAAAARMTGLAWE